MFQKSAVLVGVCALLFAGGCKTQLDQSWTLGEVRGHAEKIDAELAEFHSDVKENFFGISETPKHPVWFTYRN